MLDSRTSSATTLKAEPAAPRAKGAGLADVLSARQATPGEQSFGAALSDAVSERKTLPTPAKAKPSAQLRQAAPVKQAVLRKGPQRQRRSDRAAQPESSVSQGQAQSADKPVPAVAPAESSPPAATEAKSPPADAQPPSQPQPSQPADPSGAGQQMVAAAVAADGTARELVAPAPVSGVDDAAKEPMGSVSPPVGVAQNNQQASDPVAADLAPLQWIARQQAAKTNAKVTGSREAAASVQADSADKSGKQVLAGAEAGAVRRQVATGASQEDPLADLLGPTKAVPGSLDVLKPHRDKSTDTPSADQTPAAAPHDVPVSTAHTSVTADPIDLLNQAGLPVTGGAGESSAQPPFVHAAATPAGGILANGAGLVPADSDARQNMQRLATVVHAAVGQHQSVTRMQLQPPELGAVTAVLQLRQNRMELKLEVASEAARDMVSGGLDKLRDSLQQQGISLDRATVSVAPRSEHPASDQQQSAWGGQQGQGSGAFDPGQGRQQQGEMDRQVSFAIDLPIGVAADAGAPALAMSYQAGLNVLA